MSDLIKKRKEEIQQLVADQAIIPFAEKGFDLCLETFKSAKTIYQELFGEEISSNAPEVICKIYNNLINAETEVAIKQTILNRKKDQPNIDDNTLLKLISSNNKNLS